MAGKGVNRSIRLFVNGKEVEHSMNNVRKTMNNLRREINETTKGSEEYVRKSAELRKVTKYFEEMKREISGLPTFFDKLSEKSKGIVAIFGVGFGLDRMASGFRQLISLSAELADKQADVRKTTGMTKEEVRGLTQELDKLETRTSRSDLLSIAEEGGRIGIAKEDIAEFTEAMNKANVALGDVFGSAEEVASTLGKLRFLYKETAEMGVSDAYNKIGSALNELGANGVASEQNIAAFATRVGALPNAFKPSIADAMALGAAFEESGVNAEVAGRSYGILVQTAANNTAAFAKQMNLTKAEIEAMINDDPVEFFLKFTESFKGMDRSGVQMAKTLKDLGISADGVNKIIGAAANNNDRFRESIALSNQAMEEGTSLTDEYNVKNENLAATLEKINKTFVEWIDSDTVQDFIEGLVEWFGALIGAIDRTDEELNGWQRTLNFITKAIGSLIIVMISYKTISWVLVNVTKENIRQTLLYQTVIKGKTATMNLAKSTMISYSLIAQSLSGRFVTLRAVTILFGQALKSIPFVAVASAVIGLISYFTIFSKKTNEAVNAQKAFGEALKEAQAKAVESIGETISKIDSLITVIKDEKISLGTRKKAYEELVKINSIFNGLLEDEKFNIDKLNVVYGIYIRQLHEMAEAKAISELSSETTTALIKERVELHRIEKQLALVRKEYENLNKEGVGFTTKKKFDAESKTMYETVVTTPEYDAALKALRELEKAQGDQNKAVSEAISLDKNLQDYYKESLDTLDQKIAQAERNIDAYSKYSDAIAKNIVENNKRELEHLKAQRSVLFKSGNVLVGGTTPPSNDDNKKEDPEIERRRKIAEELLKIEIAKNRKIRDEKLRNREEEIAMMEDGFDKEMALLNIDQQKRKNKLQDEIDDLILLEKEYNRRAAEERKKGNQSGANGFEKQANELKEIVDIKNEELLISEKTHHLKILKLRFEFEKKGFEEKQKGYDRELMNLETHHNNELKSISNFEKEKAKLSKEEQQKTIDEIKEILSQQYGYSNEDLDKVRTFEKAKSEIILAQQKQTIEKQLEQLTAQQNELKEIINAEIAADTIGFGGKLTAEELDELILKYEELANAISKINNPERDSDLDANGRTMDQANALGAIDILGTSADEWEAIFNNLDTLGGKLAATKAIAQAMSQVWSSFYDSQNQKIKKELTVYESSANRKKSALAKQLEQGVISQENYNAKIGKLEADLEKKRAEAEYKQAMNNWKMNLLEANSNTALAVINALASGKYPANLVFAAITGALGAIQLGAIAKNKPKKPSGYFSGGVTGGSGEYDAYGRELADGPFHANEYVIPEYLRRDPMVARAEEFIEARRRGMSPSTRPDGDGQPDGGVAPIPTPENNSTAEPNEVTIAVLSAINRLNDNLEYLQENPLEAKLPRTMETAKAFHDDQEQFKIHRNKNKR